MYYSVSFKYADGIYCANIAHAYNEESVREYYSQYDWVNITEASQREVMAAAKKGMPIVEIKED